jgi:hypothetical protein
MVTALACSGQLGSGNSSPDSALASADAACRSPDGVLGDSLFDATAPDLWQPNVSMQRPTSREHAATRDWFLADTLIRYRGAEYQRFGVGRMKVTRAFVRVDTAAFLKIDRLDGVPVYVHESEATASIPALIYVPVAAPCVFQMYAESSRIHIQLR